MAVTRRWTSAPESRGDFGLGVYAEGFKAGGQHFAVQPIDEQKLRKGAQCGNVPVHGRGRQSALVQQVVDKIGLQTIPLLILF